MLNMDKILIIMIIFIVTHAQNYDWSWINDAYNDPCPSVYVYDTGPEYYGTQGFNYTTYMAHGIDNPFGMKCNDGYKGSYLTSMMELLNIVLYRLYHSKRCHLIKDPKKAKLFLIPMYPGSYDGRDWMSFCNSNINASLTSHLPYLTNETAPFHFFVLGTLPRVGCEGWFKHPMKDSLLSQITRISYETPYVGKCIGPKEGTPGIKNLIEDHNCTPHALSVPYPSSIHWSHKFNNHTFHPYLIHQNHSVRRSSLVSFAGSFRVCSYGHIRRHLEKAFHNCSEDVCSFWQYSKGDCGLVHTKLTSTFCLEPGGDSPSRKSIYDSILSGCIPVIFNDYNRLISPWHWGPIVQNASVFIDENKIMSGEIDLIKYLQAIPQQQIKAMQRTLHKYAYRIQYALDDYPNDAFEIILKGVYRYGMMRRPFANNTYA